MITSRSPRFFPPPSSHQVKRRPSWATKHPAFAAALKDAFEECPPRDDPVLGLDLETILWHAYDHVLNITVQRGADCEVEKLHWPLAALRAWLFGAPP